MVRRMSWGVNSIGFSYFGVWDVECISVVGILFWGYPIRVYSM